MPDFNQALARVPDGRLFPFGWLRIARGLHAIDQLRLLALGVRPAYRRRGIELLLCLELREAARRLGYRGGELSMVWEDNEPSTGPSPRWAGAAPRPTASTRVRFRSPRPAKRGEGWERGLSMTPALNPTIKAMLASLGSDRAFVRGAGTRLYDHAGREYLDCWAQYGVLALGHNPPAVVAAVRDALAAGAPAFLQPYRAPHAEALAEELVRRAPPGIARCVFTNSGAETVEAAIKLARVATGRTRVLSAEGGYHGSTYAAMAASGQPDYRDGFGPLPAGFDTVPYGDADALDARLARDGAQTAAFIVEPIQGRRGAHAPPAGYLARARAACTRHGVALVADEIQTGLGRTGTLFACEQEAVAPDVLLVAKALGGGLFPLGACLASERLWSDDFALRHLSTFANNNLACLAGMVTLRELDALLPALPARPAACTTRCRPRGPPPGARPRRAGARPARRDRAPPSARPRERGARRASTAGSLRLGGRGGDRGAGGGAGAPRRRRGERPPLHPPADHRDVGDRSGRGRDRRGAGAPGARRFTAGGLGTTEARRTGLRSRWP